MSRAFVIIIFLFILILGCQCTNEKYEILLPSDIDLVFDVTEGNITYMYNLDGSVSMNGTIHVMRVSCDGHEIELVGKPLIHVGEKDVFDFIPTKKYGLIKVSFGSDGKRIWVTQKQREALLKLKQSGGTSKSDNG